MSTRKLRIVLMPVLALTVLATAGLASPVVATPATHPQNKPKLQELALHDDMRRLWEDHITWTRMFIVDFAADSPATGATAERLLQNQVDIGDAIEPFYGEEAGDQLTALLKDHILIAGDLLAAAKAGDQGRVEDANARWYANADDIADFLATANPAEWERQEMRTMMRDHLALTLEEAVARLQGDFTADIAAYDEVHDQVLEMADMLSAGIVAQFPRAFN